MSEKELSINDVRNEIAANEGSRAYRLTTQNLEKTNRFLLTCLSVSAGLIGLLAIAIIVLILNQPKAKVVAVTSDLRVVELSPTDEPYINESGITDFSAKVVRETLRLDFKHWREQLGAVKRYYFDEGFKDMLAKFKSSGNLKAIVDRRLIASAVIDGVPIITAEGPFKGVYSWQIEVPIKLVYEGGSGVSNVQSLTAVLFISRVDIAEHSEGVAVKSITYKGRGSQ